MAASHLQVGPETDHAGNSINPSACVTRFEKKFSSALALSDETADNR